MKSSLLVLSIILLFSFKSGAQVPGLCGQLDFRTATNLDLENLVFTSKGQDQSQCGLMGETVNICGSCADDISEKAMQVLRPVLGSKEHLKWHENWHKVRALTEMPDEATYAKHQASGLLAKDMDKESFFKNYVYEFGGSLAGENFFYMHRMMIKMVQFELSMNNLPCIAPWEDLPSSTTDATWPVPRKTTEKDELLLSKFKEQLQRYKNPTFLRQISLSQLGKAVEMTLHRELHAFYRGKIVQGQACSPEALAQGYCDDLLPNGTSPLNKYFWKIHGLVDQILGHWLLANGYEEISLQCENKSACYQWQGTWVGRYPSK